MNDDELRELLTDPSVGKHENRALDQLTLTITDEQHSERPDVCPVCGESYNKRQFGERKGELYTRYYHGGWSSGCRAEGGWTPAEKVRVSLDRALRVIDDSRRAVA